MSTQTCASCAKPLLDSSRFCQHCGNAVGVESPTTSLAAATAAGSRFERPASQPVAVSAAPVPPSVTVNLTAPAQQNTVVVLDGNSGPGFGTRAIWFLFVGWWLTFWWIGLAWFLNATIIGLPLGLAMINRVPKVLTLRPDRRTTTVVQAGNTTIVTQTGVRQFSMLVRAIYFVLIGWWASLVFAYTAWLLCVLILTLPIGLLMFNFLPQVTTLRRN